jgi:hypothetical protein
MPVTAKHQVPDREGLGLSVDESGADAERVAQLERLSSFRNLKRGWDSYDAEPPGETAITNARQVLSVLWSAGLASSIRAVSPSAEGGVGIVFAASDQKYADIECFNDGEILAITSEGAAEPLVWPLNGEAETLRRAIDTISTFLNG